ncbi:hypothetical protein ACLB2K_047305 [Fragaria x ananassa]
MEVSNFLNSGDGRINKEELSHSLENFRIFIPDQELFNMIHKIDVDGDECVDIDEFGELYQSIMDERDDEDDMKEAFGEDEEEPEAVVRSAYSDDEEVADENFAASMSR